MRIKEILHLSNPPTAATDPEQRLTPTESGIQKRAGIDQPKKPTAVEVAMRLMANTHSEYDGEQKHKDRLLRLLRKIEAAKPYPPSL